MKRNVWMIPVLACIVFLATGSSLALGPVDLEARVMYWKGDFEDTGATADMDGYGAEVDLWFTNKIGVTAAMWPVEAKDMFSGFELDYMSLDLKWRLFSPTEHNYLAIGAGYQDIDVGTPFGSYGTSGFRAVLEGNVGLVGVLQGYGTLAYMPSMDELDVVFDSGSAMEYEFGVKFKLGLVGIYAGYRMHDMEFDFSEGGGSVQLKNDGYVAGIGFEF
jgi:hypothetical protein